MSLQYWIEYLSNIEDLEPLPKGTSTKYKVSKPENIPKDKV
jgi:hypothetical protein